MLGYLSADIIYSELRREDIVLILLSFNFFRNPRSFENWGIYILGFSPVLAGE